MTTREKYVNIDFGKVDIGELLQLGHPWHLNKTMVKYSTAV